MTRIPRWLFWLTLLLACHPGARPQHLSRLERAGVTLSRIEKLTPSTQPDGLLLLPGDYLLTGHGVHAVVGGMGRSADQRGSLLELRSTLAGEHSSLQLMPTLYVAGVARPAEVQRIFIQPGRDTPTLRVEAVVRGSAREPGDDKRLLYVASELSLGRVAGTLSITLRAQSSAREPDLRFGAHVQWGGPSPFIAGTGVLGDEDLHHSDWLAAEGRSSCTGVALADQPLSARARYEQHEGQRLPLHTELMEQESFSLQRGTARMLKLGVFVASSGMADMVRSIGMWRGRAFPEVWAYLPYRPEGTRVELRDERGQLLLSGQPDEQGRVALPLVQLAEQPAHAFEALAVAYGHAPSDQLRVQKSKTSLLLRIPRGGQIRVRAVDEHDGRPLSVRARVLPAEGAPELSLGPDYRAAGAGDTVIAMYGSAALPVPPGRYRVLISRGLEWSLHDEEVMVTDTFSPLVQARLTRQVEPGPYVGCDLHVHAAPSPDSQVSLADRLASLAAEGVEFAVPTDHNHVTDYAPVAAELGMRDFSTVSGVEITTWEPAFGHFNAYPLPYDVQKPAGGAPEHSHQRPGLLFDALHALDPNIVVQVNHPRLEGGIGYFDVMRLDARSGAADPRFSAHFDAIEVFNGFDLARPDQLDAVFYDWLALLARGQRVVATGSSDSHQIRYQLAGYPRTYARVGELSRREPLAIVRAIKHGSSFVSSGPFLEVSIDGLGPGEQVRARQGTVRLRVQVRAPSWLPVDRLRVFVGPTLRHESAIGVSTGIDRLDETLELAVPADNFVVVRVESNQPITRFFGREGVLPIAFSNPIFIDADGDGQTRWSPAN